MTEIREIESKQKWFEYISTLQPYLKGNKESPLIELTLILQTFILEAEQSINLIQKESIKQDKRAKLGKLYQAHDLAIQSSGILTLMNSKNLRQQIRLNELESTLIELATENKILKDKLEWLNEGK